MGKSGMKTRKNGEKNSAPMKRENGADLRDLVGVKTQRTERVTQLLRGEQVDDANEVRAGQGGQILIAENPAEKSFRMTALTWRARAQPEQMPTIWRRRGGEIGGVGSLGNGGERSSRWRSRARPSTT